MSEINQNVFYTPTTINAPLPSKGLIYPESSILHNKEFVAIREMSGVEEDILTSPALIRSGNAIDYVLKNCLLEKDIDINELILGDRNSLIISLVLASYGTSYKVDITCNNCDFKNKDYDFNISQLPIKNLEIEPTEKGKNEFEYELPKSKLKIRFKLLTHKEDREIREIVDKLKKLSKEQKEKYSTTRMKYEIVAINNIYDKNKIISFIESNNMPIADTVALRNYIDKISPDIITEQEFKCSNCGETDTVKIPIDYSFFWRGAN